MSRIDNLIQRLCPDGVRHYELREVSEYSSTRINAAKLDGTSFVGVDNLMPDKGGRTDANYSPNTSRLTAYSAGDLLIGNIRPYLKKIWLADRDGGCSGDVLAVHVREQYQDKLSPRFLYYLLSSDRFFVYDMQHAKGAKMPRGDKDAVMKFCVPVPPLPVQKEIVRILDSFTSLETELETELEARKKQYEYYRARLLGDSADTVMRLGDIFDMRAGTHISTVAISQVSNETQRYPCFGGNGIRGYVDRFTYDGDVVFIGRQGALCGNVHRMSGKFYATEHAVVVTPKIKVDMSWAFHKLTQMNLNQFKTKSAQPGLAVGRIKELTLRCPPFSEQHRIASMLDGFDDLVSNLSSGLPAEIAARRQQYEYYRDRLLAFKELSA